MNPPLNTTTNYKHSLVILGFYNNQIKVLSNKSLHSIHSIETGLPSIHCGINDDLSQIIMESTDSHLLKICL